MHLIKASFKKSPNNRQHTATILLRRCSRLPSIFFLRFLCICVLVLYFSVVRSASIDGCLCLSGSLPLLSLCLCLFCVLRRINMMMMMMMMQELCTQVVSIPAVVSDCSLRQLQAATSYQECKCLLHSGALLTTDWQCGTVCRQQCETVACHYTYAFKWQLNTIRCCCSVYCESGAVI